MTAPAVKNCGSCRWWGEDAVSRFGRCSWPGVMPDCIAGHRRWSMLPTDGTTCPCYAPREGGEETR